MTDSHTIQVPLPGHASPTREDEEDLRALFEAIAGVRFDRGRRWRHLLGHLREAGWRVECGLQWHVTAHRGREVEEACGATRDEAFEKLDRVTHAETVEGTP